MDDKKRVLKGSESRDNFKLWHKSLSRQFYACDLDFVFVDKYPPRICAVLDYKKKHDGISFSEVIAYNHLIKCGIPVFIVYSDDLLTFTVYKYLGGDFRPYPDPTWEKEVVLANGTVKDFEEWERNIRRRTTNPA